LRLETPKQADKKSKQRQCQREKKEKMGSRRESGMWAEAHAREVDLAGPFATDPVAVGAEALVPGAVCAARDEFVDEGDCWDFCRNFLVMDAELNGLA
jgi:hypothetical protein